MDRNLPMPMRDSTVLRSDVYRPDDAEKHPAIFFRTPYDKSQGVNNDFLNPVEAAHAGYAVVIQDVRGRFASDGEWTRASMFTVEGPDGYDSVEWIAVQTWCDGNVGMAGASYLAGLQWAAAMETPPHLKAIAPWMGTQNAGMESLPNGGAILLAVAATATPMMALDLANRLEKEGRDVAEMRRALQWALDHPDEVVNFLPLNAVPFAQFDRIRETWQMRLQSPPPAEQAKRKRFENVTVPCFYVCGWYDIIEWATFDSYARMRGRGGTPQARAGQHIVVGPWQHARVQDYLGGVHFGMMAGARYAQLHEQNLAFFDKYLCGRDIALPRVRYFAMGKNRWQTADDWPLPQTQWQRFYFHSDGGANTAAGNGTLDRDGPGAEAPDLFVYDPARPVPTIGGRLVGVGLVPGPFDQSSLEKRNDVLCYTSAELENDLEITGPLNVHLFAATSARDTDFTAKLVDVCPDGRAYNIVEGIIRASGRKLDGTRELVTPAKVNEYVIQMGDTSQLFRQGHRLRLEISSSNFPMFDRNLNTGNPIGTDARGVPALQTIYHQAGYASYIDLPVNPDS